MLKRLIAVLAAFAVASSAVYASQTFDIISEEDNIGYAFDGDNTTYWQGNKLTVNSDGSEAIATIGIRFYDGINTQYKFTIDENRFVSSFDSDMQIFYVDSDSKSVTVTSDGDVLKIAEIKINPQQEKEILHQSGLNNDISVYGKKISSVGDVYGTKYETAYAFLSSGFVSAVKPNKNGDFDYKAYITPAEAQSIMLKVTGITSESLSSINTSVNDIRTKKSLLPEQIYAVGKSQNGVLFEDAAKLLVTLTGADTAVEESGSVAYPNGYIIKASDKKITKGIDLKCGDYCTKGDFALMLYQALKSDYEEYLYRGNKVNKDELVMKHCLGIEKASGTVTETRSGRIDCTKETSDDIAVVGDLRIRDKADAFGAYLGADLDFYYAEKNGNLCTLVCIDTDSFTYRTLTVKSSDITNISQRSGKINIEYFIGNKKNTAALISSPLSLYNGINYTGFAADDLTADGLTLEFTSFKSSGAYSSVNIISADDCVVSSVNTADETLYFEKGKLTSLELGDKDYKVFKNGASAGLSSISSGDIVSVLSSKNKESFILEARSDSVSGVVNQVFTDESDDYYITVNGEKFALSNLFLDLYCNKNGNYDIKSLLGISAEFFVNVYGKIAYRKGNVKSNTSYGVILNAMKSTNSIDDSVIIQVLTSSGAISDFTLNDKIKFNGKQQKSENLIKKSEGQTGTYLWDESSVSAQYLSRKLIEYKNDDIGKITSINMPKKNGFFFSGYNNKDYNIDEIADGGSLVEINSRAMSAVTRNMKDQFSVFDTSCMLSYESDGTQSNRGVNLASFTFDADTPVFIIPGIPSDLSAYSVDKNSYLVGNGYNISKEGYTTDITVTGYNTSGKTSADYVLAESSADYTPGTDINAALITSVTLSTDANGDDKYTLHCIEYGKNVDYVLYDTDTLYEKENPYDENTILKKINESSGKMLDITKRDQVTDVLGRRPVVAGDIIIPGDLYGGYMRGMRVIFDSEMISDRRDEAVSKYGDVTKGYTALFTTLDVEPRVDSNTPRSGSTKLYPIYGKVVNVSDGGTMVWVQTNIRLLASRVINAYNYKILTRENVVIPVDISSYNKNYINSFYKINMKRNTSSILNLGDVHVGDEVFVRLSQNAVREFIIYEWE